MAKKCATRSGPVSFTVSRQYFRLVKVNQDMDGYHRGTSQNLIQQRHSQGGGINNSVWKKGRKRMSFSFPENGKHNKNAHHEVEPP